MTEPDPKTVREIARKHIRSGRTDIGTTVALHFGRGVLSYEEFAAWEYDVHKAWRVELRAVEWPDEQQPADVVTAEQQQDGAGAGEAAGRSAAFCDAWGAWGNAEVIECTLLGGIDRPLTLTDLDAVLAARTALTARVAELESERTEDARAVDAVAAAEDDELLDHAISNLIARFADRIEALDATETEES